MAYSELIKNISKTREYMREFFVYGFKSREEIGSKSTRSYDNEKRRISSWLDSYMSFHQDENGKAVFISADSKKLPFNPLYNAYKSASFTKNDISLHFILLDILRCGKHLSISELLQTIDSHYIYPYFDIESIDESTLRNKLKEYIRIGLIKKVKVGKKYVYSRADNEINLDTWQDAISFFSENAPLGVIGSFLKDLCEDKAEELFSYKHRYFLFALDNEICLNLLELIHSRQNAKLIIISPKSSKKSTAFIVPLKIFISSQGGRQYLAGYNKDIRKLEFIRLDSIIVVKRGVAECAFDSYQKLLKNISQNIWGVSLNNFSLEHIEMRLAVGPQEEYIINRLMREKRNGEVRQTGDLEWCFETYVYDTRELLPWLRTFLGRITYINCSNKDVEKQFWRDFSAIQKLYMGETNVI